MKFILLSHFIDNQSPYYVGTTKPSIKPNTQIKNGDDYNTYILKVGNHCGTHVDAPKHFIENGKNILDFDVNELIFNHPLIAVCHKGPNELIEIDNLKHYNLDEYDCILFRTGFGRYREENLDKYLKENPGISPETVDWIRENHKNIRCLGIDCISISRYNDAEIAKKTHITAFKDENKYGSPLLLIEDMNLDLTKIRIDSIVQMIVIPWQVKGIDSAPCTVIAIY
jgi:arylformamidase